MSTLDTYPRSCPPSLIKARLQKSSRFPCWTFCRSTTWVSITVTMAASPLLPALRRWCGPCMRSPSTSPGHRSVCSCHIRAVNHQSFLTGWFFPSAGSVHLADLLHGGGRRAGHTSAEQLQTHPPHLQPRRFHVQRCQTPPCVVLSPTQVGCIGAAASRRFPRRFHLQILTGTIIAYFNYTARLFSVDMYCKTVGLTQFLR